MKSCQEWWFLGEYHQRKKGQSRQLLEANSSSVICDIVHGMAWATTMKYLGNMKRTRPQSQVVCQDINVGERATLELDLKTTDLAFNF